MATVKPSAARSATDALVLRALIADRRLTRAELADRVAISKPTASESVRRLTAEGLLHDSGARTTGRGRVGTYYEIPDNVGAALVVEIAPPQVTAEMVNLYGEVTHRAEHALPRPARQQQVNAALREVARETIAATKAPVLLAHVSAADPVDRTTGCLVHLPDAPFLMGDLEPVRILGPLVKAPIHIDNDVNWAAQAERDFYRANSVGDTPVTGLDQLQSDNFAYLYLGEGLGGAIINDGTVVRGHAGLAVEPAHVLVAGPDGQAMHFVEVFGALGLRYPGSTGVDIERTIRLVNDPDAGRAVRSGAARAVAGVISAVVALADPAFVVLGGPWGALPPLVDAVREEVGRLPRPVTVRAARVTQEPPLQGARAGAVRALQDAITQLPNTMT